MSISEEERASLSMIVYTRSMVARDSLGLGGDGLAGGDHNLTSTESKDPADFASADRTTFLVYNKQDLFRNCGRPGALSKFVGISLRVILRDPRLRLFPPLSFQVCSSG